MLGPFAQPHQVASTMPSTSPIAQPVRQCRVAETAVFQDASWRCGWSMRRTIPLGGICGYPEGSTPDTT